MLSSRSLQLSFAIIAGNWAVHKTTEALLANLWAKWSLVVIFVFLGSDLLGTRLMSKSLYARHEYAEADLDRWGRDYETAKGTPGAWPYTSGIQKLGAALRELKLWAPTGAAVLFVISLFVKGGAAS